ncbi:MAG: hypothetical protein HYY44_08800 [Deltaproteobacteria bacterium]|nr:hypothetical protein [Deltaproteobacteria bacterium]MBI4373650.1 hypothetical protein [Deltaproteobacteria bacterium]
MGISGLGMIAGAVTGAGEMVASGVGLIKETDYPYISWNRDGFRMLGLFSGAISTAHFMTLFRENYRVAKALSIFALGLSAVQLGVGIYFKAKEEGSIKGQEIALVAVQTGLLVFGLHHSTRSLGALVAAAHGGNRGAIDRISLRAQSGDVGARNLLGQLAMKKPEFFFGTRAGIPFSSAVPEGFSEGLLQSLLNGQVNDVSLRGGLLIQAIHLRPNIFQPTDMNRLLSVLRGIPEGPHALDILVAGSFRSGRLAGVVIEEAPRVFRGEDWVLFGGSLRAAWPRVSEAQRGEMVRRWKQALRIGQDGNMRPTRDLFRTVEKREYDEFVERHVRGLLPVAVAGKKISDEVSRLSTPLLEDMMINSSHSAGATGLMEWLGIIVSGRRDVDIGAFDFLWGQNNLDNSSAAILRKAAMRLLALKGANPRVEPVVHRLRFEIHGEERLFGQPGLFHGWFGDARRTLQYQGELLDLLRFEDQVYGNRNLMAVASYHHLGVS